MPRNYLQEQWEGLHLEAATPEQADVLRTAFFAGACAMAAILADVPPSDMDRMLSELMTETAEFLLRKRGTVQ